MPRGYLYVIVLVTLITFVVLTVTLTGPAKSTPPVAKAMTAATAEQTAAGLTAPEPHVSPVIPAAERHAAPELRLPLKTGTPGVTLSSLRGKVVILDFWATWCGPCRESIPDLEKIYKKYHAQGLEVFGISVDDTAEPIPAAMKKLGMTYPVVMANDIPDLRSKFEIGGIPAMYVVDRHGRLAAAYEGYGPSFDIDADLKPVLAE